LDEKVLDKNFAFAVDTVEDTACSVVVVVVVDVEGSEELEVYLKIAQAEAIEVVVYTVHKKDE